MLILYAINSAGRAKVFQKISGSETQLTDPQHAIFSRDGERLIVSNWVGETFTIYPRLHDGSYSPIPVSVIPFPERLPGYKPHGMEISPSGKFIAVAFGASAEKPKAVVVFGYEQSTNSMALLTVAQGNGLPGIPKGVCFSPDESHLMVTFSDANCIQLHRFDAAVGSLCETPCQTVQGALSRLDRPEDIKVSYEGDQVIVSNSGGDSIAFYRFDAAENRIVQPAPEYVMEKNQTGFEFPHGVAVSPDGHYLVATQFGPLPVTPEENIIFSRETPTRQAKLWIFERLGRGRRQWYHRNWPWTPWFRQLRDRVEKRS